MFILFTLWDGIKKQHAPNLQMLLLVSGEKAQFFDAKHHLIKGRKNGLKKLRLVYNQRPS